MFKLEKNEFIARGRVEYQDSDGNRITIFGKRDGSSFTAKIRFKDESVKIGAIKLAFPYDCNGVNFDIKKNYQTTKSEDEIRKDFQENKDGYIKQILKEAITVIQRWTEISILLAQHDSSNLQKVAMYFGMSKEDVTGTILNIIGELEKYEEMEDLVKLYKAFASPK